MIKCQTYKRYIPCRKKAGQYKNSRIERVLIPKKLTNCNHKIDDYIVQYKLIYDTKTKMV